MFNREQFLKWRFKHPEKSDFTYEQYLHWAYEKQRQQTKRNILIAIYIITIILTTIITAHFS